MAKLSDELIMLRRYGTVMVNYANAELNSDAEKRA